MDTFPTYNDGNSVYWRDGTRSSTLSVGPGKVSVLFMFSYIASAGDETNPGTMFRLLNTAGGAQERFSSTGAPPGCRSRWPPRSAGASCTALP